MPDPPAAAELLGRSRRPHLVGVAGAAMRSLATLLVELGREVSGSDSGSAAGPAELVERGVCARHGHDAANVDDADLVVASAAVPADNVELVAARRRGIPILSHAQALGGLMATRNGIGVAGTHGKSTTTALVAHLLAVAGRDPTLAGGADALDFGGYARLGHGPELVAEADEFGRRFLELHPRLAIITGIEPDHLDYYGSFAALLAAFQQFVHGMPPDGLVVTCEDEPSLARLPLDRRRIRYGWAGHADWRLERFEPRPGCGGALVVRRPDGSRGRYEMQLTGRHHAANAVAALAVARQLGVADAVAARGLASFRGTRRRFETLADVDGVRIVDDYAIHPTELAVSLRAARDVHPGRLVAVFQPHTTHRTRALLDDFAVAFADADRVIVTPIYRPTGRESGPAEITSAELVRRMRHPDATAVGSLDEAYDLLVHDLRPGTLVIVFGAGDVTTLSHRLARAVAGGAAASRPAGVGALGGAVGVSR
jgi:UDP-N-acetylmuramate--alanine ligase